MPPITLHRAMRLRGLTFATLAQRTGLTVNTLWRIADGRQRPYSGNALKIAEALHLDIADVVELNGGDDGQAAAVDQGRA